MKAGFAVLIGRSNVGKSTLLNALVGTKIAITSPKPQTTRFAIHGIVHDPEGQIVFVDTPGIFEKSYDSVTKALNQRVKDSLHDIDAIVYVVDPTRAIGNEEHITLRLIEPLKIPKILVINKIDSSTPYIEEYRALSDRFNDIIEISALRHKNLKPLIKKMLEVLPEGEPFYPEFQFTNIETKKWIEELIREKLFIQLGAEIPYSTTVEIQDIEERKDKNDKPVLYIDANILTTAPRYKKMIIGSGGHKIKEIGSVSRRELEGITDRHVFLNLQVVVEEHWPERLL